VLGWLSLLLAVAPAVATAELIDRGDGLLVDPVRRLTWVADGNHVVRQGASKWTVVSRARALAILRAMNAGTIEGFGRHDWRLPTTDELSALFADPGVAAAQPILVAWHRAFDGRHGGKRGAPDQVLLWPVAGNAILPGVDAAVVLAINSVQLKNSATVASGDVVVNAASPGPTLVAAYELGLEPFANTAAGTSLRADSVRINSKADVGGDVAYNELSNSGTIHGSSITPLSLPVFGLLPPFPGQPPSSGAPGVTVPAGGSVALAEGEYGAVSVGEGGTLLFSGGKYSVLSINAADGAQLLFSAESLVRVDQRMATGQDVVIGPIGSGVAAHDVGILVAGIDGTTGALGSTPRAVELGHDNLLGAGFYAPNGTLRLGHGSDATGALLARDVLVENQSRLALDSFFFNRPPVALADSATVAEGGTVSLLDSGAVSVLANDSDLFDDPLTAGLVSGPSHGNVTLAADGTFSYVHDGSETTSDSFVYEACDDAAPPLCAAATVTIVVTPVNDPPVAVADAMSVAQGGTTSTLVGGATSLLANDSDPDSPSLLVTTTPVSGPLHGTLTLAADGTFTYLHDSTENFSDSFVYEVCDGGSPVLCATAAVTISIAPSSQLTVVLEGSGSGSVTSSPAGIDCGATCTATFAGGTVTLTPQADSGSVFAAFGGDADCADGSVAMTTDVTCTVRFELASASATVTVALAGTGSGRVASSPSGLSCPGVCTGSFAVPSRLELFTVADPGSIFVGWSGDPDCADGMLDLRGDTSCTATFDLIPPPPASYMLSLVFLGGGSSYVSSNPSGVLCESDCSVSFAQGQTVVLFARELAGTFAGWGGDCAGTGASTTITLNTDKVCTVTTNP
jgi:hypothetical protein